LSHGTLQCKDKEASNHFYTEVLGLDIMGGGRVSTYIGHAETPWYVVVLPAARRHYLAAVNRFTLKLASPSAVESAHATLSGDAKAHGVTHVGELTREDGEATFLISDLDRNWWEITSDGGWQRAIA
jgi:catechol 2,3-dioxygenase-like lactoylglutathione lyase family enzyme